MTGNHISSAYSTVTNTAGQEYTMTETGSNFTLTDTGSLSSNDTGSGNTIEGTYTTNTVGTDNYTLQEHGTNLSSQSFSQSITGTDNYTISETGNQANNTYSRGISGGGSYNETSIVASSPTILSGSYSLSNSENADARTGALSQSGLLGRYSLLTYFVDVSNADASSPGNMNFSPVGRAFVDPNSEDDDADEEGGEEPPALHLEFGNLTPPPSRSTVDTGLGRLSFNTPENLFSQLLDRTSGPMAQMRLRSCGVTRFL